MRDNGDLSGILDVLHVQRAIDFSGYRTGTLMRRIDLRLLSTGTPDYAAYLRYLSEHPAEIDLLLDALTITVSHFFRNPLVFEVLHELVIPSLAELNPPGGLRVWCAGCARGEEAYSVSMLISEICSREIPERPVYILASDIDRPALAFAVQGCFQGDALAEVKKHYLDTYFYPGGDGYRVVDELRSMVTFVRHDVTTCRAPKEGVFSDYHLILCRNTLIYFNRELGEQVVTSLARSLTPGGYLVLGEAETLPAALMREFREIFPRTRIYRKGL
jgi:chemotaxis methyl-accepting protein methylase